MESIRLAGWWQGSLIEATGLVDEYPQAASCAYWVVISQTCNLYNGSFEKVPKVELVGAELAARLDPKIAKGFMPRVIHTKAYSDDSSEYLFEVNIGQRMWISRDWLAKLRRPHSAIRDLPGDPDGRYKEVLVGWLARSYTRIELPDAFNNAIASSRLGRIFDSIAKLDSGVHGIFFEVTDSAPDEDEDGEEPAPMSAGELAVSTPPWYLEITVVCHDHDVKNKVAGILLKVDEKRYDVPPQGDEISRKLSCRELAAECGLHLIGAQAVMTAAWGLDDLIKAQRFTNHDYLSGVEELEL